ncbi:hypothetical protein DSO57_1011878 [Entomophthora muscae]|uniref:Uncharacterized protein n=1 Tax=Entomophthora muscae TaxID=34485 RepID=A0ACC2RX11_9FUNG|nr:hypothetical protein DSO57_1011878 [Entomophthora muscae]
MGWIPDTCTLKPRFPVASFASPDPKILHLDLCILVPQSHCFLPFYFGSNYKICCLHAVSGSPVYPFYLLNLWEQISSSVFQVGDNPSQLLHLVEDLPDRAQDLLISDEHLVKSLTCDDLDLLLLDLPPRASHREDPLVLAPPVEDL